MRLVRHRSGFRLAARGVDFTALLVICGFQPSVFTAITSSFDDVAVLVVVVVIIVVVIVVGGGQFVC